MVLRIPDELEDNHFEGIATGNEFWFQYFYLSSTTFARLPTFDEGQSVFHNWMGRLAGVIESGGLYY
jgi:hypothetical protein